MTQTRPVTKLLIANRGEIATRILRTARAMGIRTVAVHSDADAEAEHVRQADQAVRIGGNAPADSYLRVDAILDAARATGADAIHPGYGFLAENPALPAACAVAGITFVGPSADAIRAMGDKAGAKALMEQAGVPVVPGYAGADQSPDTLMAEARKIGFPLMIKATAGGGGRGMRLVTDAASFPDLLTSARSEAKSAFGDDTVLLERAIVNPRHVEIQILADRHGNAIHLGERDCSVQRRHQKVIEEAPSPAVSPDLRARMGAVSTAAALAIGYEGAGTFEYLLDADGNFYFMEMNTRLQVEHPVTEAITGLDLVALQLRIAAGEPLPLAQDEVTFTGHAIELRLCAEDPAAGFLPQSGVLGIWRPSPLLRADHGLRDGAQVPPFYDSMVAKLIAHGPTRQAALARLSAGLADTLALGVRTNQTFLSACLSHPVFADGAATTAFIDSHRDALLPDTTGPEARAAMILAALLRAGPGTGLAHAYPAPLRLTRSGTSHTPQVRAYGHGRCTVTLDGQPDMDIRVHPASGPNVAFDLHGARHRATLLRDGDVLTLHHDGQSLDFTDDTYTPAIRAAAGSDGKLRASMNGTVVAVAVAVGDTVTTGQKLAVLEAMKMEHTHAAPLDGTIAAIHVTPGTQVTAHAVLIEVTPA
ncbi:acetyl/propionyl/methylcrotonyl-CoA carboxylase subunit alpha [Thalassovita sp.]|uniref:acetyl/propionyl/methylcrotonyl-CoA carboxylase subunit alpha n=1 Tax=Thalassovita sp. TaxID=1979401 RepID=UPI0029DE68C5|nr:biotin carboxylase N-terminal domain-containing protein [Thalassovita sp.]